MNPSMQDKYGESMKVASTITLLAGLWFFISPWVYGADAVRSAWNSWIVGAAVVILAAIRLSRPLGTVSLSWINCVLGIWTFFSPWIYGYVSETGRSVNSFCVGVIMLLTAVWSATSTHHMQHPAVTH